MKSCRVRCSIRTDCWSTVLTGTKRIVGRVTTAGATARYFALTPLELLDRAVSAVVTDEFNLGPAVRRWLDDDEFLIRRRIARDLDAALAAGG